VVVREIIMSLKMNWQLWRRIGDSAYQL